MSLSYYSMCGMVYNILLEFQACIAFALLWFLGVHAPCATAFKEMSAASLWNYGGQSNFLIFFEV